MMLSRSLICHKGAETSVKSILYHLHEPKLLEGGSYVLLCDDGSIAGGYSVLPQWEVGPSLPIDLYPLPLSLPEGSPARTAIATTLGTAQAVQEFLSKLLHAEQKLSSGHDS